MAERQKKKKIPSLLGNELAYNQARVDDWFGSDDRKNETGILAALLKDELWRAFSDGGELAWIDDVSLLDELSSSYDLVRAIRYLSEKHFDSGQFLTSRSSAMSAENLLLNLENASESFSGVYCREALGSIERSTG